MHQDLYNVILPMRELRFLANYWLKAFVSGLSLRKNAEVLVKIAFSHGESHYSITAAL